MAKKWSDVKRRWSIWWNPKKNEHKAGLIGVPVEAITLWALLVWTAEAIGTGIVHVFVHKVLWWFWEKREEKNKERLSDVVSEYILNHSSDVAPDRLGIHVISYTPGIFVALEVCRSHRHRYLGWFLVSDKLDEDGKRSDGSTWENRKDWLYLGCVDNLHLYQHKEDLMPAHNQDAVHDFQEAISEIEGIINAEKDKSEPLLRIRDAISKHIYKDQLHE